MRKALQEIQTIERYLNQRLTRKERADFRVRLMTDPHLYEQVEQQRVSYHLIQAYGRRQLRRELQAIHRRMMARPSFRERILTIFQ